MSAIEAWMQEHDPVGYQNCVDAGRFPHLDALDAADDERKRRKENGEEPPRCTYPTCHRVLDYATTASSGRAVTTIADCPEHGPNESRLSQVVDGVLRVVRYSEIHRCPLGSFKVDHYRLDGSCLCTYPPDLDPDERRSAEFDDGQGSL